MAMEFAKDFGKKAIDMTPGGHVLNNMDLYRRIEKPLTDIIWGKASAQFAGGVEGGEINLFVKDALPTGMFKQVEEGILDKSTAITKWIFRGYFR